MSEQVDRVKHLNRLKPAKSKAEPERTLIMMW
jgi:hypothetical protein